MATVTRSLIFLALLLAASVHALTDKNKPSKVQSGADDVMCFAATANAEKEVPPLPNTVKSTGQFAMEVNTTSGEASFLQLAEHVDQLFMTHLHWGNASTNGPVIVPLTPGTPVINNVLPTFVPPLSTHNGAIMAAATFNSSLLTGPLAGADMEALVENIMDGGVYVNYHTVKYPAGIMRGQLQMVPCTDKQFKDVMSTSV